MRIWIFCLILLVFVMPLSAQDEDESQPADDLERMLSLLPGSMTEWELISYANYDAIIAARPGIEPIESWQEFLDARESEAGGIWMAAFRGTSSGPQLPQYAFSVGERIPEVMGFEFFDISQAMDAGNPPANVVTVLGEFDVDAVTAAHEARGFTSAPLEGYTVLCGSQGCDEGMRTDYENIDTANLFGGDLGRSQPILVSDDLLLSTTSYDMIQAIASGEGTLGDDPHIQTLMDAVSATEGSFIQAWLIDGAVILPASSTLISPGLTAERRDEILARLEGEFEAFPRFNLMMFSDHATETEQIAQVILTYENAEDAELAADVIPRRIEAYESLSMRRPFRELIEDRGATVETSVFTSERTGYSATVISFRAPLPSNDADDFGMITQSSIVYRLFVQALIQRDLGWLSPEWE